MFRFSTIFIIVYSVVLNGGWAKKNSKCIENDYTYHNKDIELPIELPEECSEEYEDTDPEPAPPITTKPPTTTRPTTTRKRPQTTSRPVVPSPKTTPRQTIRTTPRQTTKLPTTVRTTSTTATTTLPPSIIIEEGELPSHPPPDGRPTLLPWRDAHQMVDSLALLYGKRGTAVAVHAPYGMIATSGAVFVNATNAGVFVIHYSGYNEHINPQDLEDELYEVVYDSRFWSRSVRVRHVSSKVSQLYPHRTNLVCVSSYADMKPYVNKIATAMLFNVPDVNDYVLIVLN
jgi:hypothetical protein